MKVMHMISGGDSGGAKTHLFSLIDELKQKCEVVVVCLMKGVFYNEILEKDIETLLFEQKNRFDFSVVADIKKEIKKRKIDILHVHGARANFIATFLKKHISIPIVTTMHSDYLLDFDAFFKKIVFTKLNEKSLKKLDYFIAVSDAFTQMLIERNFNPNNIYTVYNGIDVNSVGKDVTLREDFAKKYNLELNDELIYVGIAARFDSVKGVDIFIKGAHEAYKKNKNLRFLIAGTGEDEKKLKNLSKSLGMEKAITFLGFVKDIYGFLNFIDINSLTSFCESFPYSMLEGALMKKPMVASLVGGISALVKNGETGYTFESMDYCQMAEKLLLLSENKENIIKMGQNIYDVVKEKFSSEILAKDHMEIYKSIISDFNCKKRYDFVLSGYYGFNNSGDDALLLALITELKAQKEGARIAVLSSDPKQTKLNYRVDAFDRVSPFKLRKIFKKSSVLLSGGGSLIQDETSSKSLWYYLYIIAMAKKCKMKVMQIASGIGPVTRKLNRKLTTHVLNKNVERITLREEKSLDELKNMNINIPTTITADPAITLEGESKVRVEEIFSQNGFYTSDYICVALRQWKDAKDDFETQAAKSLDYAKRKYKKDIVFIPMQYPQDLEISKKVISKMEEKAYLVETSISITDIIGVIKNSSLVIAMRLHSLVYAVSSGVGVIAIKYDPKIDGFMQYFKRKLICDVETLTNEELNTLVDTHYAKDSNDELSQICIEMKEKAKLNARLAIELLENTNDR